jgi:exo-beta-1,3-glucanase (GH17 family)
MIEVTVTIQIGNSDDKLTQSEWAEYVNEVKKAVELNCTIVHFFGGAETWKPWQNVCWIIGCSDYMILTFKDVLTRIRLKYNQDSIAFSISNTEFI